MRVRIFTEENLVYGDRMTKRIAIAVAAIVWVAVALPVVSTAQERNHGCRNQTIRGSYGFTIEGQKLGGPGPIGTQFGVAMTTFDGMGNLAQIDTVTIGGVLVADFTHPPAAGTYTVNPDCTGTFNIVFEDGRPPVTVNFVVVNSGDEIDTVVTPAGGAGFIETGSIGKRTRR